MSLKIFSLLYMYKYLFLTSIVGLVLSITTLLARDSASLQADTHFCHEPRLS